MKSNIAETEIQTGPGDSAEVADLKLKIFDAENRMLSAGLTTGSPEIEQLVAAKMRAGLKREDAIVCSRRQVMSALVTKERDAAVTSAKAKVEKEFDGKDKHSPDYKQAMADAFSKAVADGKFHEKFVAAGSFMLPSMSATN
jgi:hypothetical protein